jgi:putative ABC transport system permease protein
LGKPLRVSGGTLSGEFIVTGVLKTLPNNSHLQFDFLLPMDFLLENFRQYREEDGWVWENFVTYIKVNESVDINAVGEKYDQLVITNIGEKLARLNLSLKTGFQPVVDVHLKSDNLSGDTSSNNGNRGHCLTTYDLSMINFVILDHSFDQVVEHSGFALRPVEAVAEFI